MLSRVVSIAFAISIVAVAFARQVGSPVGIPQPIRFPPRVYQVGADVDDAALAALGAMLFADPILSVDNSTSCETCHQPFAAFAHVDHALSHGVEGRIGRRNVPSLQNLAWQTSFMWDGSIRNLDMQSLSPLTGHDEMDADLDTIVARLAAHTTYPAMMQAAFGTDTVTAPRVLRALGRFLAGLVYANTRYDRYMAGTDTLSEHELRGLGLFRTQCATCHAEPLFTNNGFANNGLRPNTVEPDSGRYLVTHSLADVFAFRVPTLRNITRTHPYMHDGRYKRLRDVLAHYASRSARTTDTDGRVQQIDTLTDAQRKDIIAFLMTLEDPPKH